MVTKSHQLFKSSNIHILESDRPVVDHFSTSPLLFLSVKKLFYKTPGAHTHQVFLNFWSLVCHKKKIKFIKIHMIPLTHTVSYHKIRQINHNMIFLQLTLQQRWLTNPRLFSFFYSPLTCMLLLCLQCSLSVWMFALLILLCKLWIGFWFQWVRVKWKRLHKSYYWVKSNGKSC